MRGCAGRRDQQQEQGWQPESDAGGHGANSSTGRLGRVNFWRNCWFFARPARPGNPAFAVLTGGGPVNSFRASLQAAPLPWIIEGSVMKVRNSLRSLKKRDKDCRVIRRKGRVYVINKKNPRFKARQG